MTERPELERTAPEPCAGGVVVLPAWFELVPGMVPDPPTDSGLLELPGALGSVDGGVTAPGVVVVPVPADANGSGFDDGGVVDPVVGGVLPVVGGGVFVVGGGLLVTGGGVVPPLLALFKNASNVLPVAGALMAKTIPCKQWVAWAQKNQRGLVVVTLTANPDGRV